MSLDKFEKIKSFKPAEIGITKPAIDILGGSGKSMAPAAKAVRRAGRAGIVGRKVSSKSL